jgi:uncharacterized membrane protein (UPF0182 family)
MSSLVFQLLFLAVFALVAWQHTNWHKSAVWLAANVATLVVFGLLSFVMNNLYCVVGVLCGLGMVVDMLWFKKVPFKANFLKYVRTFFMTTFFFPVMVFEEVYASSHPTLPPVVPPTV